MSFHAENVQTLQRHFPSFSEDILKKYEPDSTVAFFPSSTGDPTCEYKGLLLHSRHDPKREARRMLDRERPEEPDCCVFAGFGLGYQIEAFIEKFPDSAVIVFEPDVPFFLTALTSRDFTGLFDRGNITLLLGVPPAQVGSILSVLKAQAVHVHILRPFAEQNNLLVTQLKAAVNAHVSKNDINRNTLNRFGKLWVRNLVRNLDILAATQGVHRLENRLTNFPALMLAGGPSLDAVLPSLPLLKDRFILIAVDTSLRASLSAGVEPDFLVVVDPQYWNNRHIDTCTTGNTILISESSTYPAVFRRKYRQIFFCSSLFPLGQYIEKNIGIQGTLGAGGSVATTAWDFCRYIGSKEIIAAGLDLGYPAFSTHFKGSFFEKRALALSGKRRPAETANFSYLYDAAPFYADSVSGGKTLTDKRMMLYKWWFENQLAQYPTPPTMTLSAEGLFIEGMRRVDVDTLLNYPEIRDDLETHLDSMTQGEVTGRTAREEQISTALRDMMQELEQLLSLTEQGVRKALKLKDTYQAGMPMDMLLQKLSEVDAAISRSSIRDIAGFLVYGLSTEILTSRPKSPAESIAVSTELYQAMADSIRYHLKLLDRR